MKFVRTGTRGVQLIVLLPLLALLGGCSLFGVATKGNLEDLAAEQDARDERMATQLAGMSSDLNAVENQLNATVAELGEDVNEVRQTIITAQLALQSIQIEMDALSMTVDRAGQDSRMALDLQKETLVAERNRLRLRLQQLDDQIASWQQTLPASTPARSDPIRPEIVPERPTLTEKEPDRPTGDETSVWDRKR